MMFWFVVLFFVTVHAPDGQEITINTAEISSIRRPQENAGEHFAAGTKCILVMTNGKFIATTEDCKEVINSIREEDKK
jgi:uncharacterized protein YlzI (FlbEa/FlbD family)